MPQTVYAEKARSDFRRKMRQNTADGSYRSQEQKGRDRRGDRMITDPNFWKREVQVNISLLDLMAMHGALCLALRHPQFKGEVRAMIVRAVKLIGNNLVTNGALTPEQLAVAQQIEAAEGSGDLS